MPDVPAARAGRLRVHARRRRALGGAAPGQARARRGRPARRGPARDHASASSRAPRARVANALEGLGVTAGERAFVMLPRIPEWYELLLGMFRRGVIPMPATTLCTARDIAQRIERAQATVAVVDDEAAAKLADGARPVPLAAPRDRRRRRRPRPATSATTTCSRAPATPSRPRAADARRRSAAPLLHLGHGGRARRWCSTRTPRWAPATRSRRASGRT